MRFPRLYDLTKREQRTVIVIVIALVAGSVAIHYRDLREPMPVEKTTSATPPPASNEEESTPSESP